jgi:DNA mismatch repair protein MutS2
MNEQAFEALEYESLRAIIRRRAQTAMGRSRIEAMRPFPDIAETRASLRAVGEAAALRERGAGWSFDELADPSESLARLRIAGATLEPLSLLELARLCEQAEAARAAILPERLNAPVLWEIVKDLARDLSRHAARIASKILPSGELDDRASPELARIRHDIVRLRSSIARALENLMRRSEEAIQDQIVTVRNDRFVIPVRSDHRGRVGGVAHGFSSSGQTVFIEPFETIEANNELQNLRETEEREIARILSALTEELRAALPEIETAARIIAELDFINAKASFARSFDCVEPEINDEQILEFDAARHPLLEANLRASGKQVVPVSFRLDRENPVMIISGANAGGKTVVLKTAGLLALMALSGLHVPARRARIPFYAEILADIGDAQSLAANLSTFTAHVSNVRRMMEICGAKTNDVTLNEAATNNTTNNTSNNFSNRAFNSSNTSTRAALVLLDEVGTGTDPEEGSALGVAVVDYFRRACGAHVIATTHYSGLKMYAANERGVLNASVEFDEKTLQPTYRLLTGVAGSSSGLEIARRFGFPEKVIADARAHVSESSLAAADYLRRIKREADEAELLRRALEEERRAVAEKYAALDVEANKREQARQREFEREMRSIVTNFEAQARELASKIEDRAMRLRVERETERRAHELRRAAQKAATEQRATRDATEQTGGVRVVRHEPNETANAQSVNFSSTASREIRVGDTVRLPLGTNGTVERITDGEAEVRAGSLRFRERLANLELVAPADEKNEPKRGAKLRKQAAARGAELRLREADENIRNEINVIGQTTDEATNAVDKFLDEAYLQSLARVRIIHGHGTGALRRAIANLLETHPHVARFALAPPDQGGAGATVVELKQ